MHFLSATTSLCQLDMGFTLDASGSLHDKFSTEKRLTREFVRVLGGIGADTIRAGVVIFSDTAKHIIKLNTHKVREGRRIKDIKRKKSKKSPFPILAFLIPK